MTKHPSITPHKQSTQGQQLDPPFCCLQPQRRASWIVTQPFPYHLHIQCKRLCLKCNWQQLTVRTNPKQLALFVVPLSDSWRLTQKAFLGSWHQCRAYDLPRRSKTQHVRFLRGLGRWGTLLATFITLDNFLFDRLHWQKSIHSSHRSVAPLNLCSARE